MNIMSTYDRHLLRVKYKTIRISPWKRINTIKIHRQQLFDINIVCIWKMGMHDKDITTNSLLKLHIKLRERTITNNTNKFCHLHQTNTYDQNVCTSSLKTSSKTYMPVWSYWTTTSRKWTLFSQFSKIYLHVAKQNITLNNKLVWQKYILPFIRLQVIQQCKLIC